MKILSINQKYEINGGSDRYYFNLNELLKNKGCDIIEYAAKGKLEDDSKYNKYFPEQVKFSLKNPSAFFKYLYNLEAKNNLNKLLNEKKIDIAHLQIYYGHLTTSILSPLKDRGIPIIQTLHEYKLSCPVYTHISKDGVCEKCLTGSTWNAVKNKCKNDSYTQSLVRFSEFHLSRIMGDISKIDSFICVSRFQKNLMIKAGIPESKLNTLYNFVSTTGIPKIVLRGDYLLFFGRLEKLKGVHSLISAMKNFPELPLFVVGEGEYKKNMIDQVIELGLDNVKFLGFKSGNELWDLVSKSLAIMVPSEWYENCSMTVLEGKAHCKPIIGANIGGISEQIDEGINGFMHEPGDISSITNAIDKLISLDNKSYEAICLSSRDDLEKRYGADNHMTSLMQIYKDVKIGRSNR
jgi:glycosyltransferase involved in cell wall biosynthesis